MADRTTRRFRSGDPVEDLCRACKAVRGHKVMAADAEGHIARVVCDYCGSHHRFRGGDPAERGSRRPGSTFGRSGGGSGSMAGEGIAGASGPGIASPVRSPGPIGQGVAGGAGAPDVRESLSVGLVSERERRYPIVKVNEMEGSVDLEMMLRRVLREELGLGPAVPADKWIGGELILRPGKPGLQEKSWPIETFFHKVVMLRNRLRVLEQQVNGADLPAEQKIKLQGYITACYGTLTSFNVLFAEEEDRFKGSGGGADAGEGED